MRSGVSLATSIVLVRPALPDREAAPPQDPEAGHARYRGRYPVAGIEILGSLAGAHTAMPDMITQERESLPS